MPVIEWGSCTNCGRSCAGPHGSFCSDVCRVEYNKKQQAAKGHAKPATPTDQPTHQVPRGSDDGCRKKFALLAGTGIGLSYGVAYGLFRLARLVRR